MSDTNHTPELVRYFVGRNNSGAMINLYRCGYCSNEFESTVGNIKHGNTRSCGCLKRGRKRTREPKVPVVRTDGKDPRGRKVIPYTPKDETWPILEKCNVTLSPSNYPQDIYACGFCGKKFLSDKRKIAASPHKSCGCMKRKPTGSPTHAMTGTRIFRIWLGMRGRCNPDRKPTSTRGYADRGIKVCEEWKSFQKFMDWATENGYKDDLTIDRIDNDGDYCPENCRWVTMHEQCMNKRNTRWTKEKALEAIRLVKSGLSIAQACRTLGIPGSSYGDFQKIVRGERILLQTPDSTNL